MPCHAMPGAIDAFHPSSTVRAGGVARRHGGRVLWSVVDVAGTWARTRGVSSLAGGRLAEGIAGRDGHVILWWCGLTCLLA
jgi:hypothetical protein